VTENKNTTAVISTRSSLICTPHRLLCGDKIENNEMGGACSLDGGGERHVQDFGGETDHRGDQGRDGRIILRWIFKKQYVGV
jgi:hypothetical protein